MRPAGTALILNDFEGQFVTGNIALRRALLFWLIDLRRNFHPVAARVTVVFDALLACSQHLMVWNCQRHTGESYGTNSPPSNTEIKHLD